MPLHNRKILVLSGDDSTSFLQGLITNDISLLKQQPILWTGFLNPKGLYLFDAFIIKDPNANVLYLDLEESSWKDVVQYLHKHSFSHNVMFGHSPAFVYTNTRPMSGSGILVRDPRAHNMGWRFYTTMQHVESESCEDLEKRRIQACIPKKQDVIARGFILEYRFLELNGLSLTKGCYIGQEVTARMYYRNIKKYQLFSCFWETGVISNKIFSNQRPIGSLTPSRIIDKDITWGLAFLKLESNLQAHKLMTHEKQIFLHTQI